MNECMELEKEKRVRTEEPEGNRIVKLPRLDPSKFYETGSRLPTSQDLDWKKKLLRIRKPLPKMYFLCFILLTH